MSGTTTAVTGKLGVFQVGTTRVARSKQFSVNTKLASKSEWGDSDTEGYTARMPGRKDGTFSANGVFDSSYEQYDVFAEGDKVEAILWLNTTLYYDFPCAMCDDFSLQVNIDTQEVIGWSSNFGADGKYYKPGEAGATARTLATL